MKKSLLTLIIGLAIAFFAAPTFAADEAAVQIHGFISQGYLTTTENNFVADSKNGTLEFNELGLNFSKRLTNELYVGIQLFARDFGETGNHEVKIDWALADYRFADWLGLRIGQLKAPHGLYNEYRDIDSLRTYIFLPQSIYPEITREVTLSIQGGGLYGLIDMQAAGRLSYQALFGTQKIDANSDRLTEALSGIPTASVDNEDSEVDSKYVGSLAYDTPLPGLRLGVSYDNIELSLSGRYNTLIAGTIPEGTPTGLIFDTYENWVYSLEYTLGNLVLMSEYMDTNREYLSTIGNLHREKFKYEQTGWYVGGTYRLTDWLELGGYYSETEADADLGTISFPDYYDELKDICGTVRIDINTYSLLKLEYHSFTGAKGLSAWDNPPSSPDNIFISAADGEFAEEWTMFAIKATVAF